MLSFPLRRAVMLNHALDSVRVWTCCNRYMNIESTWSKVVFVGCVMKMARQKCEQCYAFPFLQSLAKLLLWLMKCYKGLMENVPYPGHKFPEDKSGFKQPRGCGYWSSCGKTFNLNKEWQEKSKVTCEASINSMWEWWVMICILTSLLSNKF